MQGCGPLVQSGPTSVVRAVHARARTHAVHGQLRRARRHAASSSRALHAKASHRPTAMSNLLPLADLQQAAVKTLVCVQLCTARMYVIVLVHAHTCVL